MQNMLRERVKILLVIYICMKREVQLQLLGSPLASKEIK